MELEMHGYAEIKGFQYRIEPGQDLRVPYLGLDEGKKYKITDFQMIDNGKKKYFGDKCTGYTANADVVENGRYDKINVFKKKRRKGYKVKNGHRQDYTTIRIKNIVKAKEK
jgi:large subunit ribosomal protein L21